MAFIPEDGIGRPGANAYITLSFLRDYSNERGRTAFAELADDVLKTLVIRATDYIETRWSRKFKGERKTTRQGLSWPRLWAYDDDYVLITRVPPEICRATVELAQRAEGLDRLMPDPPAPYAVRNAAGTLVDASSGEIHSETKTVGPISKTTTYAHSGLRGQSVITHSNLAGVSIQEYPAVKQLIRPLLSNAAGSGVIKN